MRSERHHHQDTTAAPGPPLDTTKPGKPTGLTATDGPGEIDLAWTTGTDNTNVAGYTISRDGTAIATTYSTTYADLGVASGTPHAYTVVAFDGSANNSDPSNTATATAAPPLPASVSYTYDLADRLIAITTASGSTTSFTIDALGRHASQTVGSNPTQSYSYLGSSDTVVAINSGSTVTTSAIDAVGDRVASASGGSFGYLLADLHGNMAAAFNAAGTSFSDAFAYDAWGQLVSSVTSTLPTPWRYQGRILESAAGTPELYDFGARSYAPGLGTFISLDSVHGSAQNPRLLNGYLYADANPATLVDPDGHSPCYGAMSAPEQEACERAQHPTSTPPASTPVRQTSSSPRSPASSERPKTAMATCGSGPGGGAQAACEAARLASAPPQPAPVYDNSMYRAPAPPPTLYYDNSMYAGPVPPGSKPTRQDAYNLCMGKYAYTQSGTSPDAGQQAMTCQAQVAKQFDPPSTDDSREWAALKMLICVEFCAIAATAAPVLFGAGTAGDIAYQHVADPNKPIDFGEAGVAGIFAAITGTPEGLGTLGKLTWGLTTGSTGSSITSLLNGQGPGSSLQNQEAGFAGSVCALAKGAWGAMCTAIAGAIQGYVDNYQKQHGTGP